MRSGVTPLTLSPDGRWAAFPQRDRLLLVDLSRPSVESLALPGFNESVAWLGARVVVAGSVTVLVDPASSTTTAVPYDGHRVVASATVDATVVELGGGLSAPPALRVWTDGEYQYIVVSGLPAEAHWIARALRRDTAVVVTPSPASPTEQSPMIVALEADTASVRGQLLVLEPRNYSSAVLGWLDERTVLLWRGAVGAGGWILAWDIESGEVLRGAEVTGDQPVGTVSLGPVAT